jgi:hypothetical protein
MPKILVLRHFNLSSALYKSPSIFDGLLFGKNELDFALKKIHQLHRFYRIIPMVKSIKISKLKRTGKDHEHKKARYIQSASRQIFW